MRNLLASPLRILRDLWSDRRAVTAVTVALLVPVLVGLAGFTVDIGHLALVQKELQSSTDAAALAGGYNIPDNTAVTTANTYSAGTGDKNRLAGGVTGTMVSGFPMLKCLTTTNVNCVGTELAGGANAIQVKRAGDGADVVRPDHRLRQLHPERDLHRQRPGRYRRIAQRDDHPRHDPVDVGQYG